MLIKEKGKKCYENCSIRRLHRESWRFKLGRIKELGEVEVYDRTSYEESPLIAERIGDAEIVVINKHLFPEKQWINVKISN